MSANYTDGRAVVGSQKVTLVPPTGSTGGSTGPFVCKNIKFDAYDADRKTGTDEVGNEDTQWFTGKIPTGSCTLQFPSKTTKVPLQYSLIPLKAVGETTATNFIIFKLGLTYEVAGETMMDVSIAQEMATAIAPTDPIAGV